MLRFLFLTLVIIVLAASEAALGQSTEFTFQGRLMDTSVPPTGSYDLEFRLFDAVSGGNELGLVTAPGVSVSAGVVSVPLDFGSSFDGGPRFLQIGVRPAGSPDPHTVLNPRQQISSTPYAIRSLNAAAAETAANAEQLGGVDAAEYVQDSDPRMENERPPAPGSGNYIQNQSSGPQPLANFDISGTGRANILSATTQFNLGNSRILSSPGTLNTLVGINNGGAITTGARNTFVGRNTGVNTTSGGNNAFVGSGAGFENTTGSSNAFYGYNSGLRVTSGSRNSFLGSSAGSANLIGNDNALFGYESGLLTTGEQNSFFGSGAGRSNTAGTRNVFLGYSAGPGTTTGINNSFVGQNAGVGNLTGSHNVALGSGSGFAQPGLTFATAIGPGTIVATNNTIQLGRSSAEERVFIPGNLQVNGNIIGNLPTGSGDYIQNRSTTQSASNFNISSTGEAAVFNARTEFQISGSRALGIAGSNSLSLGSPTGSNPIHIPGRGFTIGTQQFMDGAFITAPASSDLGAAISVGKCGGLPQLLLNNGGSAPCTGVGLFKTAANYGLSENPDGLIFIGGGITVLPDDTVQLNFISGGAVPLCHVSHPVPLPGGGTRPVVAQCASSIRYKTNVFDYGQSLDLISHLRPVSFNWKSDGKFDLGLIAEEVAAVEPLLATYNDSGEVEGVKYDRIGVVLINVVKEQQRQIDAQREELDGLKAIVCELKPGSVACR